MLRRLRVVFIAISCALAATGLANAGTPISAEDLFPRLKLTNVSLSPDGDRVAFIRRVGDRRDIWVYDIATKEAEPWLRGNTTPVFYFDWANNDQLLIGRGARQFRKYDGKRWMVFVRYVDVITKTQRLTIFSDEDFTFREKPYYSAIAATAKWDDDHVYIPQYVNRERIDLARVNLLTGETESVSQGSGRTFRWILSADGKVQTRIDLSRNEDSYVFYDYDADNNRWTKIREEARSLTDNSGQYWPVTSADENDQYHVLHRAPDEEFKSIKLYDPELQSTIKTVISHPNADISRAITSASDGSLFGGAFWEDRYGLVLLDKELQSHLNGLNAFFDHDANVWIQEITDNPEGETIALLYVSSPTIAGEYYIYDFADAHIEPFMPVYPNLVDVDFGQTEIIQYTARDGLVIKGYMTHPPGLGPDDDAPFILMPHGGPASQDVYDFDHLVQFLASRGYRVLQPNFRGSTGRGYSFKRKGFGEWGGAMQDDLSDALNWVFNKGIASADQACVVGASYGGYAALRAVTSTPELVSCAVSVNGIADLQLMMKDDRSLFGRNSLEYRYLQTSVGDPARQRSILAARSPINAVKQIVDPVLVVHGTEDRRVPIEQSERFVDAATRAGVDITYLELKDAAHGNWPRDVWIEYLTVLEEFLASSLAQAP